MLAGASVLIAFVGIAVDVLSLLHGVASFRGISTPSLTAQGEQRRSSIFNNDRDISKVEDDGGFHRIPKEFASFTTDDASIKLESLSPSR